MVHEIRSSTKVCVILLHKPSVNQEKAPCDQLAIDFEDKFRARDETAYHWQNSMYCDNSHHTKTEDPPETCLDECELDVKDFVCGFFFSCTFHHVIVSVCLNVGNSVL